MVTLDDVAALAGVSRMTASNAMRGKSVVRPETARRVLAAADELGYRPNLAARRLSSGRSHMIGLSVVDFDLIFPAALTAALSDQAYARGYQTIAQQTRFSTDYERAMLGSATTQVCDGTIICWPSSDPASMRAFAGDHPMVAFDGFGLDGAVDCVFTPCEAGAKAAVEHLIAQPAAAAPPAGTATDRLAGETDVGDTIAPVDVCGATGALGAVGAANQRDAIDQIGATDAAVCGTTSTVGCARHRILILGTSYRSPQALLTDAEESGLMRLRGAVAALRDHGMEYRAGDVYPCGWNRRSGYEVMTRILADRRDFDAVFCLTDPIAIGALKALSDAGVRVPGEVALIGFDGVEDGCYTQPGLSTVAIDVHEVAASCLDLLLTRIEAEPGEVLPPRSRTVAHRILPRGSAERH